ncbi:MAG TPA: Gfo/Idh/MocA family oxidoreductase [Lacipirellulaceae bacterium]|nr:Gfo/Idh/MocA family oxidoreductase [Lacipirellulaceae bacterium]
MSRLRLAVVGVGHLGRIHARLAAGIGDIDLVAVVDARREACEAVARETGCRAVGDVRELIGEIDAAVVATPTFTHHQVASELIRGGVHVLVEKPIAPTVREADELVQLARRRCVVLQVGHVERFNPALVSVERRLSAPKYIEARRQSGYTFRSTDVGVVLDLMIHDIDVTLSLVRSPVAAADAVGISVMGDHEDMVSARLRFENGAVANLTASRTSYAPARTMQVFTATGFASLDFATRRATVVEPRQDVLDRTFDAGGLSEEGRQRIREKCFDELLVKREAPVIESNAIEQELMDFAGAVTEGREPRVTGADGRDAVAVAELVLERVREHQWDGASSGSRKGALVAPAAPAFAPAAADGAWATDDTVVLRRKAG